ncbi:cytochrome P450 [Actinomadura algeriensis]|uniref:Cytochrome P450 n=1 Tax=Actinomadura algeriensis TaxID=1679523 RepID=A0ABR9JY94_9ACTN|nr:cytochrome P450 [Actinomadura algeriensis]MBE1535554.1 cytochrome P450 [Actinomadura algeriensis]
MADDLDEVDFFRGDELNVDPYPYFDALRAKCPVTREPHHNVMMVTGYDEAVEVLHDSETFSSCLSVTGPFPGFPVPLEGDDVTGLIEEHREKLPMSDQLPTLDPPVHTAHRSLLMKLITPKRLKENEEQMGRLADGLLDTYLDGTGGEFIRGFAGPFTLLVIADLLGVPDEDLPEFREQFNLQENTGTIGSTEDMSLAHTPLAFLYERFAAYIEDRRRAPRGDVLTGLASATFPDGSVPEPIESAKVAANLFAAGQETTVRLLGTALKVIAERPDVQAYLREDHGRIQNFVEETLRHDGPIKGDFRLSRVPTTIGGVDIPAGTTVMVVNGGVNRDPRKFEDPGTFDPARANARHHVAFGRGIHTCPGAPLARAEGRAAIERILERTSDIRIAEHKHGPADDRRFKYVPTYILRGITGLHLEFTPKEGEGR